MGQKETYLRKQYVNLQCPLPKRKLLSHALRAGSGVKAVTKKETPDESKGGREKETTLLLGDGDADQENPKGSD